MYSHTVVLSLSLIKTCIDCTMTLKGKENNKYNYHVSFYPANSCIAGCPQFVVKLAFAKENMLGKP